jgi:D-alanine-D-alanine ligase
MVRVALAFNLIHEDEVVRANNPTDCIAEYDTEETIEAVKNALEAGGHSVLLIEADEEAYTRLQKRRKDIDIVFNIAEGIGGELRESEIPMMCDILGIPYTGSGPLTLGICLNKVRTKEILLYHSIPTPGYQVFYSPDTSLDPGLSYPLITKLSGEGSSMGLSYDSVVSNRDELETQVQHLISTYHQPVLVEEFIEGREFGIPIIGNDPPVTLPIIEFHFHGKKSISLFIPDKPFDLYEKRDEEIPESEVTNECPARIPESLREKLTSLAVASYKALDCKDWCRLEIRVDEKENPYVIELNPIAGIDPTYRFARSAETGGISYHQLINRILDYALERYGIKG